MHFLTETGHCGAFSPSHLPRVPAAIGRPAKAWLLPFFLYQQNWEFIATHHLSDFPSILPRAPPDPNGQLTNTFYLTPFNPSTKEPTPGLRMATMNMQEMEHVISRITLSRALADPSACIGAVDPLLNTAEGRKFLSRRKGEEAFVLIELFDWVPPPLMFCPRGLKRCSSGFEISWNHRKQYVYIMDPTTVMPLHGDSTHVLRPRD